MYFTYAHYAQYNEKVINLNILLCFYIPILRSKYNIQFNSRHADYMVPPSSFTKS